MSTYEFTVTITAAGQIEVPSNVAGKLTPGERAQVKVTIDDKQLPVRGTSARNLLKYAGLIPASDLQEMLKTIEEDCETIDLDGWQ